MDYIEAIKRFSLILEALEDEEIQPVSFNPSVLYNTYYAILVSQGMGQSKPNPQDLEFIVSELKDYYLEKYKIILSIQLLKYWKRKRISPQFEKDIQKFSTFQDLLKANMTILLNLMKNTFRTDMNRLNQRWIELAEHLVDLYSIKVNPRDPKSLKNALLKMDRINNVVHNTGDKMLDKFSNGRSLLQTLDAIHTMSPKELRSKVSDQFLRDM